MLTWRERMEGIINTKMGFLVKWSEAVISVSLPHGLCVDVAVLGPRSYITQSPPGQPVTTLIPSHLFCRGLMQTQWKRAEEQGGRGGESGRKTGERQTKKGESSTLLSSVQWLDLFCVNAGCSERRFALCRRQWDCPETGFWVHSQLEGSQTINKARDYTPMPLCTQKKIRWGKTPGIHRQTQHYSTVILTNSDQKYQSLQMNSGLSYHIKLFLELQVDSGPQTAALWRNP